VPYPCVRKYAEHPNPLYSGETYVTGMILASPMSKRLEVSNPGHPAAENKVARDIIKELKLTGKNADAVHDIIAGASVDAGRKLGYRELLVVVQKALGLL